MSNELRHALQEEMQGGHLLSTRGTRWTASLMRAAQDGPKSLKALKHYSSGDGILNSFRIKESGE